MALWLLGHLDDQKLQPDAVLYSNCINSCRKGAPSKTSPTYPKGRVVWLILACFGLILDWFRWLAPDWLTDQLTDCLAGWQTEWADCPLGPTYPKMPIYTQHGTRCICLPIPCESNFISRPSGTQWRQAISLLEEFESKEIQSESWPVLPWLCFSSRGSQHSLKLHETVACEHYQNRWLLRLLWFFDAKIGVKIARITWYSGFRIKDLFVYNGSLGACEAGCFFPGPRFNAPSSWTVSILRNRDKRLDLNIAAGREQSSNTIEDSQWLSCIRWFFNWIASTDINRVSGLHKKRSVFFQSVVCRLTHREPRLDQGPV